MADRIRSGLLLTALLTVAVAGCTSTTAGQPSPTTPGASSSTGRTTGISLPPRPKNLSFTGIEPCKLLTAQQQAQLTVNRVLPHPPAPPENEPGCGYEVNTQILKYAFVIIPNPRMGLREFLGQVSSYTPKAFSAAGFPAVQIPIADTPIPSCLGQVDIAAGQMLTIQLALTTPQGMTPDEMCAKAQQAAGMAVTTLQQLNG